MYGSHTARKSRLAAGPSSSATSANVRRTSPPTPRRSSPGRPLRQRPFWSSAMTLPDGDAEALSSAPTRTAAASAISGHTDSATNADGRTVAPGLRTGAPASVRPTSASMRSAACWRSGSRLAQSDRGLAFGRHRHSGLVGVAKVEAIVRVQPPSCAGRPVVSAHRHHEDGRGGTIAPDRRDRPMPQSNSAVSEARFELRDRCSAGAMQ